MHTTKPWDVKRFLELFTADPNFRNKVIVNPNQIIEKYGIRLKPSHIKDLWQESEHRLFEQVSHASIDYKEWCNNRRKRAHYWLKELDQNTPLDFRDWRERQANRYATQAADGFARRKRLLPFAIELSEGCSIGCKYCGLSAEPLKSVARYTSNKNGEEFNEILNILKSYIGPAGATGFLYWATDPFDNPDYERYLLDFRHVFSIPPQTTTAAWHKNIIRTQSFLEMRKSMHGTWDRFSINTLNELDKIMSRFSSEELENVDLVLQNKESLKTKSCAGKARNLLKDAQTASIACVSGFLINLTEKTIKLISPCTDFDKWPLGYAIYAEADFKESTENIKLFIARCEKKIFANSLDMTKNLKLRSEFIIHENQRDEEVILTTDYASLCFNDKVEQAILKTIRGEATVLEILTSTCKNLEINPGLVINAMNKLCQKGIFEHIPEPQIA